MKKPPLFQSREFLALRDGDDSPVEGVAWLRIDGRPLTDDDWDNPHTRCFGFLLHGEQISQRDDDGRSLKDDNLLTLLNAWHEPLSFVLPDGSTKNPWTPLLDSRGPLGEAEPRDYAPGDSYELEARSLAILSQRT